MVFRCSMKSLLLVFVCSCASAPVAVVIPVCTAAFCDGFEGGVLKDWSDAGARKGTARIEQGKAWKGRHALHVTAPKDEHVQVLVSHRLATAQETLFVRMYVWAPEPLPPHNWNYLIVQGQGHSWRLGGTTKPFGDESGARLVRVMHQPLHKELVSAERFETGRWICWEMELRSRDRAMNVWLDGRAIPAMALPGDSGKADQPWVFPSFERVDIGLQHAHPTPGPVEVWIDEVAIDARRIGC